MHFSESLQVSADAAAEPATSCTALRRTGSRSWKWLGAVCTWALLTHLGGAHAQALNEPISLNFQNADIDTVIHAVGRLTGKNFLIDPRVKGKLNIVTNTPVARDLSYQILLSALRLQGFTAVEGEGVVKIVPESDAKLHAAPVNAARNTSRGDRLVTQVFPLKFESAAQMVSVVRPLVSPNNTVTAFPANNTLVVTDYAANIDKIAAVIASIDVNQSDVAVLELQHAAAADLAPLLNRLLNEQQQGNNAAQGGLAAPQIMAEPRTNTLLVRAEHPSRISAIRQLVASLDRPGAGGNIHVVYLKNADARQVATTLNAALSGDSNSRDTGASGSTGLSRSNDTTRSVTTTTTTNGPSLGTSSRENAANATAGGTVQADTVNNAVIITAPDAIYRNLRRVIDQLDRRRAQVYIEALIAEISSERAAEFGLQWVGGGSTGSGSNAVGIIGGTNFSTNGNNLLQLIGSTATGTPSLPGSGLNLAIGGGKVNIPGIGDVLSLGVLARFLENEVRANILSTPNIITLDNEEAKIVVGRNLPFITGQYTNTGGGTTPANPFQTIERRDVGLTLQVRPQISEGGSIRLEIYQEASAVVDNVSAANGPVTTKRSIESMVLVDDGAIIALGGLVEDSYSGGEEKVPVLGDMPLAGSLFRYNTRKRSKTNLVVFLRPVILRDRDSYADLTQSRYEYVIGQQRDSAGPDDLLRGEPKAPELPPIVDAAIVPIADLMTQPADAGRTAAQ